MSSAILQNRVVKIAVIMFSLLAVAAGLSACRHNHQAKAEYLVHHVSKELALSAQQVQLLNEIKDYALQSRMAMAAQRRQHREQLRVMVAGEALDETAVLTRLDEHQREMARRLSEILPTVSELHASLTPQQKEKILAFIDRHQAYGDWHH